MCNGEFRTRGRTKCENSGRETTTSFSFVPRRKNRKDKKRQNSNFFLLVSRSVHVLLESGALFEEIAARSARSRRRFSRVPRRIRSGSSGGRRSRTRVDLGTRRTDRRRVPGG